MAVGDTIAALRAAKGWSQAKLGVEVGAGQTTISSWERGRTEPTREDVGRIAGALGVPVAAIELPHGETPPANRTVPLVGYVGAGAQAIRFSDGQGPFDHVEAPDIATEQTVAAEIRGDSLGALFNEWLVFYDDVQSPVRAELNGKLCVVGLPDGRVLVKQLKRAPEGRWHLISNTEGPLLDQEVDWAARVIDMRPR